MGDAFGLENRELEGIRGESKAWAWKGYSSRSCVDELAEGNPNRKTLDVEARLFDRVGLISSTLICKGELHRLLGEGVISGVAGRSVLRGAGDIWGEEQLLAVSSLKLGLARSLIQSLVGRATCV